MNDLNKISRDQLYSLWKNLSFGLLLFIALVACTRLLPFYLAPVLALGCALLFYRNIFYIKTTKTDGSHAGAGCNLVSYCFFYCVIAYCVIGITLNVLYAWGLIIVPRELIFFNYPYLVSLLLIPISFLTILIMVIRGKNLTVCADCHRHYGRKLERGMSGLLFEREARLQLYNLLTMFGLLTVIVWTYYLTIYSDIDVNDRDNYVFVWIVLITFIGDEIYFIYRYINLYTELCENNEIISEEELQRMTARTYVRAYIMCEDAIYVDPHALDISVSDDDVIDTPFQTKRNVSGLSEAEVKQLVEQSVGAKGELRFFYGRKMSNIGDRSLLRYFYFLDGSADNQPELKMPGEWIKFSDLKKKYNQNPNSFALLFTSDLIRLSTIIVTSKTYNIDGSRRHTIKAYRPNFTLKEIRDCDLDFQDDKWIEVASFNADTHLYKLKKFWKQLKGKQLPIEKNLR